MPTGAEGINDLSRNMRVNLAGLGAEFATGTSSSATVTINSLCGLITTEALTTGEGVAAVVTMTNSRVAAGDKVIAVIGLGTSTAGMPTLTHTTVTANTVVFGFQNIHAADDLNGTLTIFFIVVKSL
jgi:hypothetical protein